MFSNQAAEYSIPPIPFPENYATTPDYENDDVSLLPNPPTRCIASIHNQSSTHHQFLVGTNCNTNNHTAASSARQCNALHRLVYLPDQNEVVSSGIFSLSSEEDAGGGGEVLQISPNTEREDLVLVHTGSASQRSSGGVERTYDTVLWRMPPSVENYDEYDNEGRNDEYNDIMDDDGMYGQRRSKQSNGGGHLSSEPMDQMAIIPIHETETTSSQQLLGSVWNPMDGNDLLTSTSTNTTQGKTSVKLERWDVTIGCESVSTLDCNNDYKDSSLRRSSGCGRICWDPHDLDAMAVVLGMNVGIYDLRSMDCQLTLKNCHRYGICDLDYNPNRPNVIVTGGEDGLIKFWDLRKTSSSTFSDMNDSPIKVIRGAHSHWVTSVKYNKCHDQLILSGSTDATVNLFRVGSISSAPLLADITDSGNSNNENSGDYPNHDSTAATSNNNGSSSHKSSADGVEAPDIRVKKHDDHKDSVYNITWGGNADAWVYASLGYEGRVVLNHVPSTEKYKILL